MWDQTGARAWLSAGYASALEHIGHANIEILSVKAVVRFAENEFGRDILCKRAGSSAEIDGCFQSNKPGNPIAKLVYVPADQILPTNHLCFGKEGAQGQPGALWTT